MSKATVIIADWKRDEAIRQIRLTVFVEEQKVPLELEWDEEDARATHFLLFLVQQAIGTARLLADGRIGRVAILAEYRGRGFGRLLMREIMSHARLKGMSRLSLSAQTYALDFYRQLGFETCSSTYMDAGIPHQDMVWEAADEELSS